MKLMIAGGGTGGHLFPGIALAGAWRERVAGGEVFFVGTEYGLEKRIVPEAGYRLELIQQRGLKRQGLAQTLKSLLLIPRSLSQSLRIVRRERPAVAIGVGGYAAGPAILAAWLLGVPTLVLEPNAVPGLTNRLLAKVVRKAISPYARARAHFGSKLVQAGIPVRPAIAAALAKGSDTVAHKTLLVFGGSQGAKAINDALIAAAPVLVTTHGYRIIHQTGRADFARVKAQYQALGLDVDVREFIDDMAAVYRASSLVVCRAGASSLAELALCGKPSVLIPLPTAADDHQTKNAQAFAEAGAGVLLRQSELSGDALTTQVLALDDDKLAAMGKAALGLGDANAANALSDLCVSLTKRGAA